MTVFFKEGRGVTSDCFNLVRYKDKHGKWYEIRKNKLPRGDVWQRLGQLQWSSLHRKTEELVAEIKQEMGLGDK
jgi:hypothetical protein